MVDSRSRALPPLRVAIACSADISNQRAFSGIPHGLATGVRQNGYEVVGIRSLPPDGIQPWLERAAAVRRISPKSLRGPSAARQMLRAARWRGVADPHLRKVRSSLGRAGCKRAQPFDLCIQWGTDFDLPSGVGYVTYDDQTIVQAAGTYAYPWTETLTAGEFEWLVERQREVFLGARACCTSSEWAAASLVDDYGLDPARVRVVGIGANHLASTGPERDWLRPRFLFVGLDWERKNGDRILAAFRALREEHPDARLDVVGSHETIDQEGVVDHGYLDPTLPHHQELVGGLFARATCFLMPSLHEPAGIAYVEAAHAGVGSIGSTCGGSRTLIGDGGVLVDPRDGNQILEAMRRFCDPGTAAAYGRAARGRSGLFTWRLVAARLIDAFEGLSDRGSAALPSQQAGRCQIATDQVFSAR